MPTPSSTTATQVGILDTLRGIVGPQAVLTGAEDMAPYAIDWRKLFPGRPACVVRPGSTQEVAAIVQACRAAGVAIVPQSGNTGMAGGASPDESGREVIVSLNRMNRIRQVDPVGMSVEAEAGVILQTAKEAAAAQGRLLPISLTAEGSAMIGGVVSTNAGGVNVLRYGMTRGLVLGLEIVLPDGSIVDALRPLRKDNAGYDMKQIFIGAEGSLGLVTAAILRLVPQPRHSLTALIAVESPAAALRLLDRAQTELGDNISAFELISGTSFALVERQCGLACPVAASPWYVLIEAASVLSGLREAADALLATVFEEGIASDGVVAETGAQAKQLWALREHISEAEIRSGKSIKHDISVPLSAIPAFLEATRIALERIAPDVTLNVFGHLGDGNLHYNVLIGAERDPGPINRAVHDVVARFNGSISAEHGLGQYRVSEWVRLKSAPEQALALSLKRLIDPAGMMNPGKVLPRDATRPERA